MAGAKRCFITVLILNCAHSLEGAGWLILILMGGANTEGTHNTYLSVVAFSSSKYISGVWTILCRCCVWDQYLRQVREVAARQWIRPPLPHAPSVVLPSSHWPITLTASIRSDPYIGHARQRREFSRVIRHSLSFLRFLLLSSRSFWNENDTTRMIIFSYYF